MAWAIKKRMGSITARTVRTSSSAPLSGSTEGFLRDQGKARILRRVQSYVAEMTRRCSHCSCNGHNSRTCPARGGGVRLFGVRLMEGVGAMKKSASVGCLPSSSAAASNTASPSRDQVGDAQQHRGSAGATASGYASDDPARASCSSSCRVERKKGIPWTEDEHRMFLMGLQKLGKGDWRGISRNFVVSRTPTQVASHAQKYFIRQSNASRRKRRSSLFDMVTEMPTDQLPTGSLTGKSAAEMREVINPNRHPVTLLPAFYPSFAAPVPAVPLWNPNLTTAGKDEIMAEIHRIVKPTPVHVDEVVSMSKLRIGEGIACLMEPTALSLTLLGASSSRQPSAFHVNPSIAVPDLNQSNSSPIHAV